MVSRRRISPWLLALALAVTACSTTADRAEDPEGGFPILDEGAPPSPTGTEDEVALDTGLPGSPGAPGTGPRSPGTTPAGTGRRAPVPLDVSGLNGIDATTIKIGMWYLSGSDACALLGIQPDSSEQCSQTNEEEYLAITRYINANGGMAGRKVEPVLFETDFTRSAWSAQAASACAHFTEDQKVFAVVSEGQIGRNFMAHCLAQRNVPFVEPGSWPFDNVEYRQLSPFIYQPHRVRPDRWVRAYIDGLQAQGFFQGQVRVGLIRFDTAPHTRVTRGVLEPRLQQHGVALIEEAVIKMPPSVAAYSDMQSELASAILRFKRSEINRVIFFTNIGELEFFYFSQAESQAFRPRYGFSSISWPAFLSGTAPAEQLRGAVGVGWSPFFDVNPEQDPGGSAAAERCKKMQRDAGLDGGAGRNNKCDGLLFLKAAIDRAAGLGDVSPHGIRRAVEAMGTSFVPSASFSTRFGPGRYDGPATFRHTFFDDACSCFRYRGGLRALP